MCLSRFYENYVLRGGSLFEVSVVNNWTRTKTRRCPTNTILNEAIEQQVLSICGLFILILVYVFHMSSNIIVVSKIECR